jgi:hypothetical protein
VSWKDNGTERIDIFSVGADGSLSNNFHRDVSLFGDQKGYLWGNWTEVTKDAAMPVPCRPNENEAHVLFIRPSNGSLAHVFWNSDKEEWEVRNGTVADPLKMAPDTLVVGCQLSGDLIFDVYGYKTDSATMVLREIVLGITGENSYGSELVAGDGVRTIDVGFDDKFMGQPFLSQASATHYDVFALGEDGKMYHYIRSPQSTPKQQPLEGTFISTPAAVSVNLDTLVVVAVGSNGHLKYGSINGLDWNGWEDMDIIAHGAPLLMELGGKIFMVADLDGYGLAYVSWDAQDGWRQHRKPEKI